MKNKIYFGSLAVVLAAFLWSLDGLLRRSLYSLPPGVIVFWEHLLGLVVLLPLILPRMRALRSFTKKQWVAIVGVAFLSGLLGTLFYTAALGKIQYIQFSVVVLLQQLQPLFAIAFAGLLLKEPLTKRFGALTVIALVAAYFVSFPDLRVHLAQGSGNIVAALLALGSAVAWGSSTAFSKYSLRNMSTLHVTALRFAFTSFFAFGLVVVKGQTSILGRVTPSQWGYLLAITFSTGMIALAIYYFGLKRIPASRSTLLELTWPISAVALGYLFFNEQLAWTQILGSLVLIVTMIQVARDAQRITPPILPLP